MFKGPLIRGDGSKWYGRVDGVAPTFGVLRPRYKFDPFGICFMGPTARAVPSSLDSWLYS